MPSERILIVDANQRLVSYFQEQALPALGYGSLAARHGQEGLELAAIESPDLILLALNLPDMSGIDFARALSESQKKIPIVLIADHRSQSVPSEVFRLGVRDCLSQPIELGDLADALTRALETGHLQRDKRWLAEDLHSTTLELRQQSDQVAAFTSVGRAVTASLNLDSILTRVLEAATQLCKAEEATVWLLEGTHRDLVMVAETGLQTDGSRMQQLTTMRVQDALAGEAVRTRRPVLASDRDAGVKVKTGYLVKAVIYVPMLIQDTCLGVVSIANRSMLRPFSQADLDSLQVLADYAAIAIEKARLYRATEDALKKRSAELAAITEVAESVATLDLDVLLRSALEQIHQTFRVEAATLFMADPDRESLIFSRSSGPQPDGRIDVQIPFGRGLVGACAQNVVSYLTNDPESHPLYLPDYDQIDGIEARTLLAVPLAIEERVIGVIKLANKRSGPFEEEDATLLKTMAMPVAVAMENLQLFDQVSRERATLSAVLTGSRNPILIVDADQRLLMGNPAARELFAIQTGDTSSLNLDKATGLDRLSELVSQRLDTTEEIEVNERTFLTSFSQIQGVGSVIEMHDITYLKDLDRAKSEFVTTVSHDLRSPLTSIVGFTELLPAAGPLNEKQKEFVRYAIEATENMRRLIDDLLDLAKIESGISPAHVPCNLEEIANRVVLEHQGLAVSKQIELSLVKRGEAMTAMGDPGQLERALANLVGNALKYTPAGGQARVGLQSSNGTLYIAVIDNGLGIPEKDIPHIFDKFYRVQEDRDQEGSGLGLAMVKSIVKAHNGTISVRSERDKGSVFTITLPLAK
jgi:two-component system NtrC family sensor kinase